MSAVTASSEKDASANTESVERNVTVQEFGSHPEVDDECVEIFKVLLDRIEGEPECYVKSREVAEVTDLTSKQVGQRMSRVSEHATGITVNKWGRSNATVWRVLPN